MRKTLLTAFCLFISGMAIACPVCERQQPKILRGITHGAGPDGNADYVIVWVAIGIVLFTLFFSVKWLIRPGEKSADHIKRHILNYD